jgi:hypothetical protein
MYSVIPCPELFKSPITYYNKVALHELILGVTLMGPLAVAMYYHLPVYYPPEMQGGHER